MSATPDTIAPALTLPLGTRSRRPTHVLLFGLTMLTASLTSCAGSDSQPDPTSGTSPETPLPSSLPAGTIPGYLALSALPNSLALLPPPPAPGSEAFALDTDISQRSFLLRDTPRWTLAISDADLTFPHADVDFACAVNTSISEADTPHVHLLLRKSLTDSGFATQAAKNFYKRVRPFVMNGQPLCTPDQRVALENDGSYPSGHTTIGWGWALILAEISPDQADAILARGLAFGESRNVCNAHWHSDVVQARSVAAGTVAKLHTDATFMADMGAARAELADARARGLRPAVDCVAEAAALAILPSLAQ